MTRCSASGVYTLIDSPETLNYFISNQHYESCRWAKQVNPQVSKCFDCPFPICVECDMEHGNQFTKPRYIENFLRGVK